MATLASSRIDGKRGKMKPEIIRSFKCYLDILLTYCYGNSV